MSCVYVIPCYNEAARLDVDAMLDLAATRGLHLLFVNDGSKDDTEELLKKLQAAAPNKIRMVSHAKNRGKAEAVRFGMRTALERDPTFVGYADADLSTPVEELKRLHDIAKDATAEVVMGSRVKLLGRSIDRRVVRHYIGRVFATAASMALSLAVYDTQCGAKLFRVSDVFKAAVAKPFSSTWVFDVELIGRLLQPQSGEGLDSDDFLEVPLRDWHDVAGSKLRLHSGVRAALDLCRIAVRQRRQ